MRIKPFLCCAFIAMCSTALAQDLRILVNDKGLVGYADSEGNEVINCQYDIGQPFDDGTAIVTKGGKYGVIDEAGTVLLPLKYARISPWGAHLFLIKAGKTFGLADHRGTILLNPTYFHIGKPNRYGKALLSSKKGNGIIDSQGNVLVEPAYLHLYEFSVSQEDLFSDTPAKGMQRDLSKQSDTLETDCSYLGFHKKSPEKEAFMPGIIDGNGKELAPSGIHMFVTQPENGMVRYFDTEVTSKIGASKGKGILSMYKMAAEELMKGLGQVELAPQEVRGGYYNLATGEDILATTYTVKLDNQTKPRHSEFFGDVAAVSNGSTWAIIDKTGAELRTGLAALRHNKARGLWAAKTAAGTWDVFDDQNTDIPSLSGFPDIYFPDAAEDQEVFSVMKDGKYGCIDRTGKVVIPFEYEMAQGNRLDFIAVRKGGKWGMLSPANARLIPTEYLSVVLPAEREAKHIWVQKSDSLFYHMNLNTRKLSATGYKSVHNFSHDIALVVPKEMIVVDTQVNRAQLFAPNTPQKDIDTLKWEGQTDKFGYILNTDDELLMELPVSSLYESRVTEGIAKLGKTLPNKTEMKTVLLNATLENRSYGIRAKLNEDEWNY